MAQINSSYQEVRIPLTKMSFTPDVPATALGPNEYNSGENVEADVRGIRSMAGDQAILDEIPGPNGPTFVTGGFRQGGEFWFVVATDASPGFPGKYYASNGDTTWYDITPTDVAFDSTGYAQNTNITEAWNGTVLFLNDEHNPPFFWPDTPGAVMVSYSNQVPLDISNITAASLTEKLVTICGHTGHATICCGQLCAHNRSCAKILQCHLVGHSMHPGRCHYSVKCCRCIFCRWCGGTCLHLELQSRLGELLCQVHEIVQHTQCGINPGGR